jgi:hypothetical protein
MGIIRYVISQGEKACLISDTRAAAAYLEVNEHFQ